MHILAVLSRLDLARQETFLRHTKRRNGYFASISKAILLCLGNGGEIK